MKHVADHGHAAQHPLAAAAQFGMVELRHRAAAGGDRVQQGADSRVRIAGCGPHRC